MSQNLASIQYAKYDARNQNTPRLKVVTKKTHKFTWGSVLRVCAVLFATVVLGQISMQTLMAQRSFIMHSQEIELIKMKEQTQELQIKINELSSPQNIDQAAKKQSMVPADKVGYINLERSSITGLDN